MDLIYQNYPVKKKEKDNASWAPYRMNTKLKYILEGDQRVILDSLFYFY